MLYKKLEALYSNNQTLSEEYPLQEYFPLLQMFISKEVGLGAEYLSPYRFSLFFSKPSIEAVRLFLGLADCEEIVEIRYKYECDQCGTINILKNEDALFNFKCIECGFEDHLITTDYLSEVKLLFKINEDLLDEVKTNLKGNPLSNEFESSAATLERGTDMDVSLAMADEAIHTEHGKPIGSKGLEIHEKLSNYRRILRKRD